MQPQIESFRRQHEHEFRKKLNHLLFPIIQTHQPLNEYCQEEISKRIQGQHQQPTQDEHQQTINSKKSTTKRKPPICPVCQKTVRMNSKRMICTNRILLTHLHRTNTKSLTISDSKNAKEWICFPWLQLSYRFTK